MPSLAEYDKHFANFDPDEATNTLKQWLAVPTYDQLTKEQQNRLTSLVTPQGAVLTFTDQLRLPVTELIKVNRHFAALDLVNACLTHAEKEFREDDLITARYFAYGRRGHIKEHLAVRGEYSRLEPGDFMRTIAFLSAADDLMRAELEVGCVTDLGMRVSECYGGAQVRELRLATLRKVFGTGVTVVHAGDNAEMAVLHSLMNNATRIDTRSGGQGLLAIITVPQPNPRSN